MLLIPIKCICCKAAGLRVSGSLLHLEQRCSSCLWQAKQRPLHGAHWNCMESIPTAGKQTRKNGWATRTRLTCAVVDGWFTADNFPPEGCKFKKNNNNNNSRKQRIQNLNKPQNLIPSLKMISLNLFSDLQPGNLSPLIMCYYGIELLSVHSKNS